MQTFQRTFFVTDSFCSVKTLEICEFYAQARQRGAKMIKSLETDYIFSNIYSKCSAYEHFVLFSLYSQLEKSKHRCSGSQQTRAVLSEKMCGAKM